jgi:hypothetical protein
MSDLSLFENSGPKLPIAKFEKEGDLHQGTITKLSEVQEKSFVPGNPGAGQLKFWPPQGGAPVLFNSINQAIMHLYKPVMQLVVELDNEKVVFAGGKILKELRAALKAVGKTAPELGAQIGFKLHKLEENGTANPTKNYQVKYVPPTQ